MKMRTKETVTGIAFSSVFLLGFTAFFIIPFIISVYYTFTFGTGGGEFVGFRNYIDVFKSVAFKTAALNTVKFIGISVPLINVIAMVLSLMLN